MSCVNEPLTMDFSNQNHARLGLSFPTLVSRTFKTVNGTKVVEEVLRVEWTDNNKADYESHLNSEKASLEAAKIAPQPDYDAEIAEIDAEKAKIA